MAYSYVTVYLHLIRHVGQPYGVSRCTSSVRPDLSGKLVIIQARRSVGTEPNVTVGVRTLWPEEVSGA